MTYVNTVGLEMARPMPAGPATSQVAAVAVLIPVTDRYDDATSVYAAYRRGLEPVAAGAEFIYVLDGPKPELSRQLEALRDAGEAIRIIALPRPFGEAAALTVGFLSCASELVLTLPPYLQVEPAALPGLFEHIGDADLVVASRDRRDDLLLNRLQGRVFHDLARFSGSRFNDLGCGVRLMRSEVTRSVATYGEQHRFFPILAESHGFRIAQVVLPQHGNDRRARARKPLTFVERLLDLGTLYFMQRFTRKPFRFFGAIGLGIAALGVLVGVAISVQKFAFDVPLADRPALILCVLLLVLGVQVIAMGLIGEIVVFTRAKNSDDMLIEVISRAKVTTEAGGGPIG